MKLGARIFKTALAVVFSLVIAQRLSLDMAVMAAIAAVLAIQPTVYRSWTFLLEQLQANCIGAAYGIALYFAFGNDPFIVGLAVMLVIATNLKLGFDKSVLLSLLTVITIMQVPETEYLMFALERFALIMIGVAAAIGVNILFLPPKYERILLRHLIHTSEKLSTLMRMLLEEELAESVYKQEREALKQDLDKASELFSLYQEEFSFKRSRFRDTKKLVIFKQMLALLHQEWTAAHIIKKHVTAAAAIPLQTKQDIKKCLFALTSYDEKIFFKYEKQLIPKHPHQPPQNIFETNDKLSEKLMALYQAPDEGMKTWFHVLPLITALIDLSYELEHLERLVDNYLRSRSSS